MPDGRILAIDYGKRRTGIAVSDPLQLIAGGLCTVETPRLKAFITDYLAKETVAAIVVGLPTQTTGEASENQQRVRTFTAWLKQQFPETPVHFYDERFTSVIAQRAIIDGGIPRMKRRNKALTDEVAATIILEDFLESRRPRG